MVLEKIMVTTRCDEQPAPRQCDDLRALCAAAADRLYDAEVALHVARTTHVDPWIAAAYDRLHAAVAAHLAAAAELAGAGGR
jgi:hypothetical protein